MARNAGKINGKKKKKGWVRRFLRLIGILFLAFFIFSLIQVLIFKWIPPLFTPKMLLNKIEVFVAGEENKKIYYQWRSYEDISPYMVLAVIAAEDQKFPSHFGFDIEAIEKAIERNKKGENIRGASTISQQVAKNMFCWPSRTYFRKALETYYTVWIELLWSKKRIVEVYVNIAEMGPEIYGAEAAAQQFFNKPASELSRQQAALLAAVLPNPILLSARNPSAYVVGRRNWVVKQMQQLGDKNFLKQLL